MEGDMSAPEPLFSPERMVPFLKAFREPQEASLEQQEAAEFRRLWHAHVENIRREQKLIRSVQDGIIYPIYDRQEGRFIYEIDPDWVDDQRGRVQFEHLLYVALGGDEESSEGDEL